jgi:hypothetical protein
MLVLFPEASRLLSKVLVFIPVNYREYFVLESLDRGGRVRYFYLDLYDPAMWKLIHG